ncbi:hypothetical protein [Pseudomonas psychrophila]|uniref:hypothetical protein n=1 Tax=Pseudomonas psychrophila TaxID=122355 RepID=UPI000B041C2F|nr:hypothetical protein [Pseudomonas psychrophila]
MNNVALASLLAVLGTLPAMVFADVELLGKVTSRITATVTNPNNFFVTSDTGGWFDQGLEMSQPGGGTQPMGRKPA